MTAQSRIGWPATAPSENHLPGGSELGVVLARNDAVAVGFSGIRAFPDGFLAEVWFLQREGAPRLRHFEVGASVDELLRITYADGRSGEVLLAPRAGRPASLPAAAPPVDLLVLARGGFGGGRHWRQELWIAPLPPDGPVEIELIGEASLGRAEVSGADILEAAARAVELWPAAPPEPPVLDPALAPQLPPPGRLPSDPTAAEQSVRDAFAHAFSATADEPLSAVQDGRSWGGRQRRRGAGSRRWQRPCVALGDVVFLDGVRAAVQYELRWSGAGEFGPQLGYAVFERGGWKVARGTYCRLLDVAGVSYPPPPPVP